MSQSVVDGRFPYHALEQYYYKVQYSHYTATFTVVLIQYPHYTTTFTEVLIQYPHYTTTFTEVLIQYPHYTTTVAQWHKLTH